MKKTLVFLLMILWINSSITSTFNAQSVDPHQKRSITGFEYFEPGEDLIVISKDDWPSLNELTAQMPETMVVYLNDSDEKISIPVEWTDVSGEFEDKRYYYYQFSPVWDEQYVLDSSLDYLSDVPYFGIVVVDDFRSSKTVSGSSNEETVFRFLTQTMSFNAAVACGILANIEAESAFNPSASGDSGTSHGICQWHNSRWTSLVNYCNSIGYSAYSIDGQLRYLQYELSANNGNILYNGKTISDYLRTLPNSADGAYEAGRYWCYAYEVPANKEAVSQTRGNRARNAYWPAWGGPSDVSVPTGYLDAVAGTDRGGTVFVNGWSYDPDKTSQALKIHIYIGGTSGNPNAEKHVISADTYRDDVNQSTGAGSYHGFSENLDTLVYGSTEIHAYAINISSDGADSTSGNNPELTYSPKTVVIPVPTKDNLAPSDTLTYNGNVYERYDKAMTWDQAKAFCESKGGHLATITSSAENNALADFVAAGTKNYYALGATDQGSIGTWRWITGEPFSYQNWDTQAQEGTTEGQENAFLIAKDNQPNKQKGEWIDNPNNQQEGYKHTNFYHQLNSGFICEFDSCEHEYSYEVTSEPGLEKTGMISGICSKCGRAETVELPKLNETDYGYEVIKEPTCVQTGTGRYSWDKTGGRIFTFDTVIEKIDHEYIAVENAPTCQDYGSITYTCSMCGDSYTEYLPDPGEDDGWSTVKPVGVPEEKVQTKTQYSYSDYQTKDSYDTTLAGWTQKGSRWERTGSGSVQYVQGWPAGFYTGHSLYGAYNNSAVSYSETATAKTEINSNSVTGYVYYHWCRGTYAGGPINRATSKTQTSEFNTFHAFYSTTNPSGLAEPGDHDGSRQYANGSVCKDSYWYYNVPVYTQTYTTYRKLFTYERWSDWSEWSDTAYTETSTRHVREQTLYKYDEDKDSRHIWDEGTVIREATCTEDGETLYTCTLCGEIMTVVTPAKGHNWGEPSYEWAENHRSITAERICANDQEHNETETVETVYAVVKAPTLTVPGEVRYSAEFQNGNFESQSAVFADIPALNESRVLELPAGLKVIREEAFAETSCDIILIPDGCETIESRAFADCENLLYVYIPETVHNLAEDAFDNSEKVMIDRE